MLKKGVNFVKELVEPIAKVSTVFSLHFGETYFWWVSGENVMAHKKSFHFYLFTKQP